MFTKLAGLTIVSALSHFIQGFFAVRLGRSKERAEQGQDATEKAIERNKIDAEVAGLSDSDLDDRVFRSDD